MKIAAIIIVLFVIGWGVARYALTKSVSRHFGVGLLAAFAIISIAGMLIHNPIIYLGTCFCACLLGVRSRLDAACRYLLLSALTPNITYQATIGGNYLLGIHPTMIFLFALMSISFFLPKRKVSRRWGFEDAAVAALVFIAIVAESRAPSATGLIRQTLTPILTIALPFWLISQNVSDRTQLATFFGVIAGCAMILAVFSLYEVKFGWSLFDGYWANFQVESFITRNLRLRSGLLRTPTTFNESTAFAVFQTVGALATLYSRRLFRSKAAWLASCGLVVFALLAAQSRGALIGLTVGIAVVMLYRRSYLRAGVVLSVAGAVVGGLLALARVNHRVASFVNADAALVGQDYRQRLFSTGVNEGLKHFWIGQDREATNGALQSLVQGENIVDFVNTYLTIFLNSGIIGLATLLIPLCLVFVVLWNRRDLRRNDQSASGIEYAVGPLSAIMMALVFTSFYERNPLWLIVALASSKIVARRALNEPRVARGSMPAASESIA